MKRLYLYIIISILCADIYAQTNETTNGACIKFSTTVYDFDTIVKNSDGTCCFEFTNQGTEPLIITSAFSSCGCTVPSWPEKPVLHGEKGTVSVQYNTGKTGTFQKIIVVKSNSIDNPKTILRIRGVVVETSKKVASL